ncbi:degenerin-like protein unc-105 isoform X1 [Tachypleus tridentatus]|uniref:degenerin-like protein unc-105 isoform X1 n=1 Tax=Tachypleus tridentatus TaxID=6853 RepID=UPI003FD4A21A
MCYTINGEWETGASKKPITSRMILEEPVEISFTLDVEPREYLVYDRDLGARVVVHDPNVLPDPESEGIDLKAGTSYQIGIQQTSTVMLPPPYQTRCAHAQEIAIKLNITYVKGMSRQRCLKECQRLFLLDRMGCVSKSLSFLYQERCCSAYYDSTEEDKENMTKAEREAMKHCYDICSVPCMKTSYELSVVTSALKKEFYPNYSGRNLSKTAVVEVKVVFDSLEQVTYTHRPRYEFVELFSYLGGYIGIWLGTSLISCLELLETSCKWALAQMKRGRVKRKITRQVHVISKSRP